MTSAKQEREPKFGMRERENAGTRILVREKKNFEKARGNAEREEEMKERGHATREGPAGTRAQLWILQYITKIPKSDAPKY